MAFAHHRIEGICIIIPICYHHHHQKNQKNKKREKKNNLSRGFVIIGLKLGKFNDLGSMFFNSSTVITTMVMEIPQLIHHCTSIQSTRSIFWKYLVRIVGVIKKVS
mmetsp:Transcript_14180/g.29799  ORF Transcript_14180/g.29799 Transcript_14180/m.29799 type:complete len:106 (+) Transcript_14180:1013-1330(+)